MTDSYVCRYCEKEFRRETTLTVHMCESKHRWQQEKEVGVQLGLKAYLRFYEVTQGSAKTKNYGDFVSSPFYNAFVKFGRHCQSIRCVSFANYLDWLIKGNKKIDSWCKDALYSEWLLEYIKREATQDALERALKEMQDYADEHQELKNGLSDYFRYGNSNRICYQISTGRISPWVIFNCESGIAFLEKLREDQVSLIISWIDPDFWQKKFKDYLDDAKWINDLLRKVGL